MKKKLILSLMMIICMMLLINVEASAATSKTTIGYPETSLYNKNDPNLVPLEPGMELTGKTLYFNTKWNLADVIPDGYFVNDTTSYSSVLLNGNGSAVGALNVSFCEDGNGWAYFDLVLNEYFMQFHFDEDFAYGNSNNWLTDKYTFFGTMPIFLDTDAELNLVLICENAEGDEKNVEFSIDDLVLVTKEPGQLISTNSNLIDVDDNSNNSVDLWTIVGYGLIIAIVIFIVRSLKR